MNKVKDLNELELSNIAGGSNNIFWTRVGVGWAAEARCMIKPSLGNWTTKAVSCGAKGLYAAVRG